MPLSPYAEPRWPVLLALASIVGLNFALPKSLSLGPRWFLAALFLTLAVPAWVAHRRGAEESAKRFGLLLNGVVTIALVASLALLIRALPAHKELPLQLLQSAGSLWISNVLVFAAWYWRLDSGGAHQRERVALHQDGAFLFPQMALHPDQAAKPDCWHPRFIDYLFLAFNTSTALSPTDTQVLSRWAKLLMMTQSLISLTIFVLLAARAVNIL
ncbi:MAG: hypothetical protein M3O09_09550 [Acidobacteriota bacterium]|nr:hypothetical protein [Acidobacteriota bacterium]